MRALVKTCIVIMISFGFCPIALILADSPQDILTKALSNPHPQSFTAVINTGDGKGTASITHLSTHFLPDGTAETRSDIDTTEGTHTFRLVQITNSEGTWFLSRKTAIKADFIEKINASAQETTKSLAAIPTDATYGEEDSELNGTKCYVITEHISDAQWNKNVENTVKALGDLLKDPSALKAFKNNVPLVTVYYIGVDNDFIYSTRTFNADGDRISDLTYNEVKFNVSFDQNTFEVPQDYKIVIAKTPQELAGCMANAK